MIDRPCERTSVQPQGLLWCPVGRHCPEGVSPWGRGLLSSPERGWPAGPHLGADLEMSEPAPVTPRSDSGFWKQHLLHAAFSLGNALPGPSLGLPLHLRAPPSSCPALNTSLALPAFFMLPATAGTCPEDHPLLQASSAPASTCHPHPVPLLCLFSPLNLLSWS